MCFPLYKLYSGAKNIYFMGEQQMKKRIAFLLVMVMLVSCLAACGKKEEYPSQDITVIVPFGAGGNTDSTIRALVNAMSELDSNYKFLVENKTGASGQVGMTAMKNSDPDGYTIGAVSCELFIQENFGLNGDVWLTDFDYISVPSGDPYALVISANNPNFSTIEEFIDYAKANPGKVKIGHAGAGGMTHVAAVGLANMFDIEFDYYAYGGSADCITAVSSGELDGTFTQAAPAAAGIKGGTLLMPLILASEPSADWPDAQTLDEVYGEDYKYEMLGTVILGAPKGLPEDVLKELSDLAAKAIQSETCVNQLKSLGITPFGITGDELKTWMDDQIAFYKETCTSIDLG